MIYRCFEIRIIALQAKMRHMMLAFLFLICPLMMHAQTTIGLDLPAMLYSEIKIIFEHKVAEHWSMSASAGINIKKIYSRISAVDAEHNAEFPYAILPESKKYMHRENISMNYWPHGTFNGIFLSFGAEYRETDGFDGTAGIGYMIPLVGGLKATARYDIGFIRISKSDDKCIDNLCIGLSWTF